MSSVKQKQDGQLSAEEARAIVYKKGQRVRVSPYGASCGMRKHSVIKGGVVVGSSIDGQCVRIVFDGTRTGQTYHKSFIEPEPPTAPAAAEAPQ